MTGAMSTTPTAALEILCGIRPLHIEVEAEARNELARLKVWNHFDPRKIELKGHCSLWAKIVGENRLLEAPMDSKISEIIVKRNFHTKFPSREDWIEYKAVPSTDLIFYTDGSLMEEQAGSGVYSAQAELHIAFSLGPNVTVYQAEVAAILACANYCLQEKLFAKGVSICSDSQAAISALGSYKFDSKLVLECREALQALARETSVNLVWVPGHSDIPGNEKADELARSGSSRTPIGPGPAIPLSKSWIKAVNRRWAFKAHTSYWRSLESCEQAKMFLREPLSKQDSKRLLSLNRISLRKLVGFLTGHFFFKKHLHNMRKVNSSFCNCEEDEETAYHLMCLCPIYANRRHKTLGEFVLSLEQFRKLSIWKVFEFVSLIPIQDSYSNAV